MNEGPEKIKRTYEKPGIKSVKLDTQDTVLRANCKAGDFLNGRKAGNACRDGIGCASSTLGS